jgi:hypothetical protein
MGNGMLDVTSIISAGAALGSSVVPEPASGMLLVVAAMMLSALRSRRYG